MDPHGGGLWARPMALAPLAPPCGGPPLPSGGGLGPGRWPWRRCLLRVEALSSHAMVAGVGVDGLGAAAHSVTALFRPRWGRKGTRHSRSSWTRWP
ncbi:hypothetical protein C2845_PM15G02170 [Panicum miliaceum]|uniref:Uncharacterized protein n=1 Tax=Panicum miliaceum TaxID=4540 RepID=A0A3L6Q7B7_PANMI|nr:hypothetical protein C2845_PM15G02170 [Panicum miliaceum]